MIRKKGISPLIATIILIAMTIAIAGILGLWAANYVVGRTTEINKTESEIARLDCSIMRLDIRSCRRTNNENVRIILSNTGHSDIDGVLITFFEVDEYGNILNLNSTEIKKIIRRGSYEILDLKPLIQNFSRIEVKSSRCPEVRVERVC